MSRRDTTAFILLATLALCACRSPAAAPAQVADVTIDVAQEVQGAIADPAEDAQAQIEAVLIPAVIAVQAAVVEALPAPAPVAVPAPEVSPAAVALIVDFEIVSPAYYTRRLQSPIYPGGASGATIGIGYDLGHQSRNAIAADWAAHPQVGRMLPAAGVIGSPARALVRTMRDVVVPLPLAERVFGGSTLPAYNTMAARAFANGWDALSGNASGSLTATVYNRGASMRGDRRREMRELRDTCVPAADTACMAAQYRSMCRLWKGGDVGNGLCRRYEATAQLAVQS